MAICMFEWDTNGGIQHGSSSRQDRLRAPNVSLHKNEYDSRCAELPSTPSQIPPHYTYYRLESTKIAYIMCRLRVLTVTPLTQQESWCLRPGGSCNSARSILGTSAISGLNRMIRRRRLTCHLRRGREKGYEKGRLARRHVVLLEWRCTAAVLYH